MLESIAKERSSELLDVRMELKRRIRLNLDIYFHEIYNRQRLILPTINDLHETLAEDLNGSSP